MRYVVPLIFFAVAGYVWYENGLDNGRYLLVPFLDLVPGYENDVVAQGQLSWKVLAGIGGLLLAWTIVSDLRRPRHRDVPEAAVDDEQ